MSSKCLNQELKDDTVKYLLNSIGKYQLLSDAEEIELGRRVKLMQSLKLHPESIEEITDKEVKRIVQQGEQALRQMIQANLRLVVAVAKNYQNRGLSLPDLIQEGSLGLVRGIERFDPDKGCRLSTYCWHWIRQALTRAIANQARVIRLPIHILEKLNKIKKAQRQLSSKLGRTPTLAEIAVEAGLTPLQVREYLKRSRQPISLSLKVGSEHDTELGDLLENSDETPEEFVNQSCLASDIERLIGVLTPQQREVLSLRFGLSDGQAKTLADVGRQLHLSRERVRQVENQALKQLRQHQGVVEKLADYWQ